MKLRTAVLLAVITMLLSGCSATSLDPQNLMHPPKPSGENAGLQEAIEKTAGSAISLKAPSSGEYRSAFVLFDLDQDGEKEALAFYIRRSDKKIYFDFLAKRDGQWTSLQTFGDLGSDIYSLDFADLNHDGHYEVLVSWNSYNSVDKTLTVFEYSPDNGLQLTWTASYSAMRVLDLNGQVGPEVLLISLDSEQKTSTARLYDYSGGRESLLGETKMDGSVTGYAAIRYDLPMQDTPAVVYVDALTALNKRLTEVLYWQNYSSGGRLIAPLNDPQTGENLATLRDVNVPTTDINSDGRMEIPKSMPLCGVKKTEVESSLSLIQWNRLEGNVLLPVEYGVHNVSDQYHFIFPIDWVDRVTVRISAEDRRWSFYSWNYDIEQTDRLLLTIETHLSSEWNPADHPGYTQVGTKGTNVYVAAVYQNDSELDIPLQTVKENLRLNVS